jgi:hypothetical protein
MNMKIEDIPENDFSQFNNFRPNNFPPNNFPPNNLPLNKKSNSNNFTPNKKNQIDYDDILKNMGMREIKGKLFWDKKNEKQSDENFVAYDPQQRKKRNATQQQTTNIQPPTQTYDNSYIHNKYFKNEQHNIPEIQRPKNLTEYKIMLIKRIIEKKRIEKIKSRQMFFN